jgi:hypothetical protein
MSEAFERERQNNARLEELSSKVSALRGVTIDIYDSARSHEVIDSTVRIPWVGYVRLDGLTSFAHAVRDLFLHGDATQGFSQPTGSHGSVW